MPFYAMICHKCKYTPDDWYCQTSEEREEREKTELCPVCKKPTFKVDFGRSNTKFVLKGRGWAFDGYDNPQKK